MRFRRVVFYNGITDEYILSMQGYCSIEDHAGQLEVTIKKDDGTYLKHHLGLSDNVTYFSEQLTASEVSDKRYTVIFKPSTIIPSIELGNWEQPYLKAIEPTAKSSLIQILASLIWPGQE